MNIWIYTGALLLGVLMGTALVRGTFDDSTALSTKQQSDVAQGNRNPRSPESAAVRAGRMISAETKAMDESMPLNEAMDVLFEEHKSPMRTRAFLKNRIQLMTRDQLEQALFNGEIQTKAEIIEAARRLTKEDPDLTYDNYTSNHYRIRGMPNLYAFIDTMLQTAADKDAPAMMKRLQGLKRGGSQQDQSLRFSNYWAKIDPAAAAKNFKDLVYLRNMAGQAAMEFTDNAYASAIVSSWMRKDEEGMRQFIGEMPSSQKRKAFESAVEKLCSKDSANERSE